MKKLNKENVNIAKKEGKIRNEYEYLGFEKRMTWADPVEFTAGETITFTTTSGGTIMYEVVDASTPEGKARLAEYNAKPKSRRGRNVMSIPKYQVEPVPDILDDLETMPETTEEKELISEVEKEITKETGVYIHGIDPGFDEQNRVNYWKSRALDGFEF